MNVKLGISSETKAKPKLLLLPASFENDSRLNAQFTARPNEAIDT